MLTENSKLRKKIINTANSEKAKHIKDKKFYYKTVNYWNNFKCLLSNNIQIF